MPRREGGGRAASQPAPALCGAWLLGRPRGGARATGATRTRPMDGTASPAIRPSTQAEQGGVESFLAESAAAPGQGRGAHCLRANRWPLTSSSSLCRAFPARRPQGSPLGLVACFSPMPGVGTGSVGCVCCSLCSLCCCAATHYCCCCMERHPGRLAERLGQPFRLGETGGAPTGGLNQPAGARFPATARSGQVGRAGQPHASRRPWPLASPAALAAGVGAIASNRRSSQPASQPAIVPRHRGAPRARPS